MFGSKRKDEAFFDAFARHASKSVEAARILHQMMQILESNGSASARAVAIGDETKNLCARIKSVEHEGDTITHDTVKRLREHWITPLDRTDIYELISSMDDVLDYLDEAAERVALFEVFVARAEATELAQILVHACETIAKAVALLRTMANAPEILQLCVEVNRLENDADRVYRRAIAALFKEGSDALTVMKWRDIFESLESAADSCEDVANIVEGVVLEYA